MARFSDAHMAQFKKMDSIANHASAFRADPSRFKPVIAQPLRKSPSKPDLTRPEVNKLKRTQSRADLTESNTKASTPLKRTQSKMDMAESSSKIASTPLKRAQSKLDLTGSSLPRSQSTVRLVPSTRDGRPASSEGDRNPAAKRVKRTDKDDAATTRPISRDGKSVAFKPMAPTPARKITSQTALSRVAASLMTPTKASIARSQSVKVTKSASMIPSLLDSPSTNHFANSPSPTKLLKGPSTNNLFSPTHIGRVMRDSARESMHQVSGKVIALLRSYVLMRSLGKP